MLILLGENISRISIQAKPHFVAARSIHSFECLLNYSQNIKKPTSRTRVFLF